MKVLVDTSVWSLALRRRKARSNEPAVAELSMLIEDGRVAIIGAVRQEILSGIKEAETFERLREHLRAFPDAEVNSDDHELAASFFNVCRRRGVQGSNTDFLICAVASRNEFPILTADGDFSRFAQELPISLHPVGRTEPR